MGDDVLSVIRPPSERRWGTPYAGSGATSDPLIPAENGRTGIERRLPFVRIVF
jgi:hypothetical protein